MKLGFWGQYVLNKPSGFKVESAYGKVSQCFGVLCPEISVEFACWLVLSSPPFQCWTRVPGSVCFVFFLWVVFGGNKTMRDSTITKESSVINQAGF